MPSDERRGDVRQVPDGCLCDWVDIRKWEDMAAGRYRYVRGLAHPECEMHQTQKTPQP